jgi:hypothetical protein
MGIDKEFDGLVHALVYGEATMHPSVYRTARQAHETARIARSSLRVEEHSVSRARYLLVDLI